MGSLVLINSHDLLGHEYNHPMEETKQLKAQEVKFTKKNQEFQLSPSLMRTHKTSFLTQNIGLTHYCLRLSALKQNRIHKPITQGKCKYQNICVCLTVNVHVFMPAYSNDESHS